MCVYIYRKKEHSERVGRRMLCNHNYSNITYCPTLCVCGESIIIYISIVLLILHMSVMLLFDSTFSSSGKRIDT
jgi:hypothetical protein